MKLIIDIDEDDYKEIIEEGVALDCYAMGEAIKNGTVLSECKPEDCISREQALEPYKILEDTDTLSIYTIRQNLAELPSVYITSDMGRYDPYTDKFMK